MNLYTADLHFGHRNAVLFDHRPFGDVEQMDHIKDGDSHVVMCHFPMAEWNKSRHGSILIYGHIHAN